MRAYLFPAMACMLPLACGELKSASPADATPPQAEVVDLLLAALDWPHLEQAEQRVKEGTV